MPSSIKLVTADEARQVPPSQCAPPMCTTDGKVPGVGAAHGRILPLVGNTRPYLYDVVVAGTDQRIYADMLTDVVCVLIGEEYQQRVTELDALDVREFSDSGAVSGYGDLLPAELAAAVDDGDETDPDPGRSVRYQQAQSLLYDLALLRTAFAERLRVDLQAAINADAVADGSWEQLSEAERDELINSATAGNGFPIGIPAEIRVLDESVDPPQMVSVQRPEWRARTKLVINTGDYLPWTPAPFIESIREAVDADGQRFEYATDENVLLLSVDTEEEFIGSLVDAGYLTMDVRPMYQPDSMYHSMSDDPIVNPYLRRNRTVSDHAEASS